MILEAIIDLAPFFQCRGHSEFTVKAVVYHLHPAEGSVVLNSGHYVAYVKQPGGWHLANDSSVSPVLMTGMLMTGMLGVWTSAPLAELAASSAPLLLPTGTGNNAAASFFAHYKVLLRERRVAPPLSEGT